ncbi:polymorphic toxin type 27 domain-containing protein, partial [Kitasatospora cineracea]
WAGIRGLHTLAASPGGPSPCSTAASKIVLRVLSDRVQAFRLTLASGIGIDDALRALRNDPNIEPGALKGVEYETVVASALRGCDPPANSFPAGTAVLMGDGTVRPIEQIHVGDSVTATDQATGTTGPQRVEATIYTPDDRDFTKLTVQGPDGSSAPITSTAHHLYWSESSHIWRAAADLTASDTLRTPDNQIVRIVSKRNWAGLQAAYNLTVENAHTYYVLAGAIPLLVHNDKVPELCNIGSHLVLGVAPYSDEIAARFGGKTFNNVPGGPDYGKEFPGAGGWRIWQIGVDSYLNAASMKISVSLDGVEGAQSADQALEMLIERGRPLTAGGWQAAAERGNGTAWEMAKLRLAILRGSRSWESITWYFNDEVVVPTKPAWAYDE